MSVSPKIAAAVEIASSRGISRIDAAPPLHRFLWFVGIQIRPPHFASFGVNAMLFGGFWGAWMEVFVVWFALHRHPGASLGSLGSPMAITALMSVIFGCVLAFVLSSRARAAVLPDWEHLDWLMAEGFCPSGRRQYDPVNSHRPSRAGLDEQKDAHGNRFPDWKYFCEAAPRSTVRRHEVGHAKRECLASASPPAEHAFLVSKRSLLGTNHCRSSRPRGKAPTVAGGRVPTTEVSSVRRHELGS